MQVGIQNSNLALSNKFTSLFMAGNQKLLVDALCEKTPHWCPKLQVHKRIDKSPNFIFGWEQDIVR